MMWRILSRKSILRCGSEVDISVLVLPRGTPSVRLCEGGPGFSHFMRLQAPLHSCAIYVRTVDIPRTKQRRRMVAKVCPVLVKPPLVHAGREGHLPPTARRPVLPLIFPCRARATCHPPPHSLHE